MRSVPGTTRFSLAMALCVMLAGPASAPASQKNGPKEGSRERPPKARAQATPLTTHGETRTDDYFWLREKSKPEVLDYLRAENAYSDAVMKHTEPLQETLYREMLGRIKETDIDVPVKKGGYYYYSRTEQGKQYPIYCRRKGSMQAREEILLDQNALTQGHNFYDLGVFEVSPDHGLLAYSIDTTGAENFTLYVKDLDTGKRLADEIPNTAASVAWASDNKTLFYTINDAASRPHKVFRHTLGASAGDDALVHHEQDETFYLGVERSKSGQYVFLKGASLTSSETRYVRAETPGEPFRVFEPRQKNVEYSVAHSGDRFFIRTNEGAPDFKVMETPITQPAKANWKEFIPGREGVVIGGLEEFKDYLTIFERQNGVERVRVISLKSRMQNDVDFPETAYEVYGKDNEEFDTRVLRFVYSSFVTPDSVYDYDMVSQKRELLKQRGVPGYDAARYQTERVVATAADGARIPIAILHRKGLTKTGDNPLLLHAYGAYGSTSDAAFDSNVLSLVDRGFVYAEAAIRGGGDMGKAWHDQGRVLNKKNTFTDFIASAEHLIREKYTSKEKLAVLGTSAGGLLMGAVTTMRPDLFKVVVARVPFVDVITTMADPSLPLVVIEWEDWGNPAIKEQYEYMKSYSPYDNVTARAYPNLLITAGLNDTRVMYFEPAKWAAKLRAIKTDDNLLLLKTDMEAGHSGASGRYDALRKKAFEYAFILDRLGIAR
jgi:oligopeptidase B